MPDTPFIHPYIPNAAPATKQAMLEAVGARHVEEFYADIPAHLRLARPLALPPPFLSEAELVRHIEGVLNKNVSTREALSFLGGGCYAHHVPAVCDEVNARSEFLTAYAGQPYEDHGRFQALFEYQSLMGELLNVEVVNVPTYDGFQAAATALRMAARITRRSRVLLLGAIGPDKLSKIADYLKPDIAIERALDWAALPPPLSDEFAAVYFENPTYFGVIETRPNEIAQLAHQCGALCVVSADPLSLGVLAPPADYGADIACGDIQSLGIHPWYGGGHGGYIATHDDPKFVMEFPSRLFGIAPTRVEGEYGFGDVAYERTSFAHREAGKEWTGTAAGLWGITAGVYLALMGPQGMRDIGTSILQRTRYAMKKLAAIPNVRVLDTELPHFREFVVNFDGAQKTVAEVNAALRARGIFGGHDLSREFPALGQSALYAITEIHTQADIDRLAVELREATK